MTYYFAYGMNTNIDSMALRCPDAENMGVGYLNNYKMVFKYHADMVPVDGHIAPGVLWRITSNCLDSLDMLEGFPTYYLRKTVTVTTETGESVDALMYYMTENDYPSEPSNSYYDMVLQGYDAHGISEKYLIDGLPTRSYAI
jgi:gamma-glutamylcyclotransferase (GGCT)/AIG2-like uncharacterized protein YtfP